MNDRPSHFAYAQWLARDAFADDLLALTDCIAAGDYDEAEFRSFRLHQEAKRVQLIEIANRAATVYASFRLMGAECPDLSEHIAHLAKAIGKIRFTPEGELP